MSSTATSTTNATRIPLQTISDSSLNTRLAVATSYNFKKIIDHRTPQLKRAFTVDVGSFPSAKKQCLFDEIDAVGAAPAAPMLPSPVLTPKTASYRPMSQNEQQINTLKTRLQMAYYKVKNQKTDVSAKALVESFPSSSDGVVSSEKAGFQKSSSATGAHPPMRSFQVKHNSKSNTRTPIAKRANTDLLASSTPIPVSSIFFQQGKKANLNQNQSAKKSVSFNFNLNTAQALQLPIQQQHPHLPAINRFEYTSSSPSRFVMSQQQLPQSATPFPSSSSSSSSKPIKLSTVVAQNIKRSLKAPSAKRKRSSKSTTLTNTNSTTTTSSGTTTTGSTIPLSSTKLPSLQEVTALMNTSTPLPSKKFTNSSLNQNQSQSQLPLPQHQQQHQSQHLFTPIKAKKSKSTGTGMMNEGDTTQLMSSPSQVLTTPSSMGAAKSLLQLAFVNNQ